MPNLEDVVAEVPEVFVDLDKVLVETVGKQNPYLALVLAAAIPLATALWVCWTYVDSRSRESRRPFLEKQFQLYFEACQVTATIASDRGGSKVQEDSRVRFRQLYWGELALVETETVEQIMEAFARAMTVIPSSPEAVQFRSRLLEELVYQLAHACRVSIARGWGFRIRPRLSALRNLLGLDKSLARKRWPPSQISHGPELSPKPEVPQLLEADFSRTFGMADFEDKLEALQRLGAIEPER